MGGTSPINSGGTLTKTVLGQKNRCSELETWQPGASECRCFKRKRKNKDRWKEDTWEVVHRLQQMSPLKK